MKKIDLSKDAEKTLKKIPKKHQKQIAEKLKLLADGSLSGDPLKGELSGYLKLASGEYRTVYSTEDEVIKVILIEKRNDAEVYKKAKRRS